MPKNTRKKSASSVDFAALSLRSKLVLLAMAFVVALFVWYGIVSWFKGGQLKREEFTHQTLTQTKTHKQRQLTKFKNTAEQTLLLQLEVQKMLQELPPESDIDGVLDKITQLGYQQKLRFIYFRPQQEKNRGFYAVMPIKIAVQGGYHNLAKFISGLANFEQLVTAGNFILIQEKNKGGDLLRMNIIVKVYSRLDKEASNAS